jgi:acetylornithine/N-succinyldiaminopimelate aminotransferase
VRAKSDKIFRTLSGKPGIKGVYGRGLLVGVEVEGEPAEFINKCIEKGVLVLGAKGRVRLAPPLNIPDELLDRALSVITAIAAGEEI